MLNEINKAMEDPKFLYRLKFFNATGKLTGFLQTRSREEVIKEGQKVIFDNGHIEVEVVIPVQESRFHVTSTE